MVVNRLVGVVAAFKSWSNYFAVIMMHSWVVHICTILPSLPTLAYVNYNRYFDFLL